jgi:hypothetical protein
MTAPEGKGIGRCLAVLVGGRSGGHEADVFAAVCSQFPLSPIERLVEFISLGISSPEGFDRNLWCKVYLHIDDLFFHRYFTRKDGPLRQDMAYPLAGG